MWSLTGRAMKRFLGKMITFNAVALPVMVGSLIFLIWADSIAPVLYMHMYMGH